MSVHERNKSYVRKKITLVFLLKDLLVTHIAQREKSAHLNVSLFQLSAKLILTEIHNGKLK